MPMLQFKQLSDNALFVQFSTTINEQTHRHIQQSMKILEQQPFPGFIELVPSYTNFCVYYDPFIVRKSFQFASTTTIAEKVQEYIEKLLDQQRESFPEVGRKIDIPVLYGGEFGPDLNYVAKVHGLTPDEVIEIHISQNYLVHMLGFAPGFPFLGGMDQRIATPRHTTPRPAIAAGSVGIAGEQTGIYPLATPGGWQIIGRTMTPLFLPGQNPPTLLRAGDTVRFVEVKENALC
ncbi:5-oxoprolinase subunit PxpB [Solibacillus silvestris]|uniref:5-oxoprolinase subunit PxpB n=1 Tax=Solibacillus silvestris TaxID=76853 RepID=UPI003F7E2A1B